MTLDAFLAGLVGDLGEEASDFWGRVFLAGLATMAVGTGIIVWRAVVRFRRHGPLAAVLAGVGGLGLALLLAVAGFYIWGLIGS